MSQPDGAARDRSARLASPGLRRAADAVSYRNIGAVYVWVLIIVVFAIWKPGLFFHTQTAKTILNQYSITALAALSIVVPLSAGIFDLSIGSTMGLAGIFAGWLFTHTSINAGVIFVIVMVFSLLIGLFNSLVVVFLRIDSFIGTLATGAILAAVTLAISGDQTFTARINQGFAHTASAGVGGVQIPVLYVALIMLAIGYFLEQTPSGRFSYATGYNPEAARLVGVRIDRLRMLSLLISSSVAGFAGLILTARIQAADPSNGPDYLIPAFSAAFLGATQFRHGRFNPWGTIVAVFMIGTGSVGLLLAEPSKTWAPQVFQGAVLIAAVGVTVIQVRNRSSTA
jgi:ribose transport system permease protein